MKLPIDPATREPANPSVFLARQNLDDIGAFRETCGYAGMNFDDALVFPGQSGASHLHVYFGVLADANTSSATIRSAPWSSCAGGTLNNTAYWMPAVIDTKDGTPQKPTSNNVYYKCPYGWRTKTIGCMNIVSVPVGLHLIAGNAANKDPAKSASRFVCLGPDRKNPGWKRNFAAAFADGTCLPGGEVVIETDLPNCWDGVNLDSPDHKSHVVNAVATGRGGLACPATHPKQLPSISYNIHYAIPDDQAVSRWRLSSDRYDPALPGGLSSHVDYLMGWEPKIVDMFTQHCLHEQRDCHNYLLGDNVSRLY